MHRIICFTLLLGTLAACGKKEGIIVVEYPGSWSGAISRGWTTTESVSGTGNSRFALGGVDYAGAVIQKKDSSDRALSVIIIRHESERLLLPDEDKPVANGATSAAYGVVSVGSNIKD